MISRLLAAAAACVCALGFGSARTEAQTLTHRIDTVSAWGGAVNAFQRVGNIGYCGSGQRLVVLDLSNPSNQNSFPELGSLNLETAVQDLIVQGNYAFVLTALDPYPLVVVDISVPAAPQIAWIERSVFAVPPSARYLRMYGDQLYLISPGQLTYAYDVSNPLSPVASYPAAVEFGTMAPYDLQIEGHYAYILASDVAPAEVALAVFDLQPNPLQPVLVGRVGIPGAAFIRGRLAVSNGRAAFTTRVFDPLFPTGAQEHNILRTADVSDPAQPVLRGRYDNLYYASEVAIQGNLVYVADHLEQIAPAPHMAWLKGFAVLDISDLTSPSLVGTYNTDHSSIRGVKVAGDRAYLLCDGQGLEMLDTSTPAQPARLGGYFSPSAFRLLTKAGDRLYAVDEFNGFTILDVSNPAEARVLGVYRGPGGLASQGHWGVKVRDNLAYLAAAHGGIQVIDVSDPAAPTLVWQYIEPACVFNVRAVELDGDYLRASFFFVPPGCPSTVEVTFANYVLVHPPEPRPPYFVEIGRLVLPGTLVGHPFTRLVSTQGVTFCGVFDRCYRIDSRDPAHPTLVTSQVDPWDGTDLEVVGNSLYALGYHGGQLDMVDVADPLQPVPVWSYPLPQPRSVGVSNGRVFLAGGYFNWPQFYGGGYLLALDPSGPAPVITGYSYLNPTEIVAEGNLLYSALATEGFVAADPLARAGVVVQRYRCATDMDDNGVSNVNDFIGFLNTFAAGSFRADIDRSRSLNVNDFVAFINAYGAGCD